MCQIALVIILLSGFLYGAQPAAEIKEWKIITENCLPSQIMTVNDINKNYTTLMSRVLEKAPAENKFLTEQYIKSATEFLLSSALSFMISCDQKKKTHIHHLNNKLQKEVFTLCEEKKELSFNPCYGSNIILSAEDVTLHSQLLSDIKRWAEKLSRVSKYTISLGEVIRSEVNSLSEPKMITVYYAGLKNIVDEINENYNALNKEAQKAADQQYKDTQEKKFLEKENDLKKKQKDLQEKCTGHNAWIKKKLEGLTGSERTNKSRQMRSEADAEKKELERVEAELSAWQEEMVKKNISNEIKESIKILIPTIHSLRTLSKDDSSADMLKYVQEVSKQFYEWYCIDVPTHHIVFKGWPNCTIQLTSKDAKESYDALDKKILLMLDVVSLACKQPWITRQLKHIQHSLEEAHITMQTDGALSTLQKNEKTVHPNEVGIQPVQCNESEKSWYNSRTFIIGGSLVFIALVTWFISQRNNMHIIAL